MQGRRVKGVLPPRRSRASADYVKYNVLYKLNRQKSLMCYENWKIVANTDSAQVLELY